MPTRLRDLAQLIATMADDAIDQPVFTTDAPAPPTRQLMTQRFRFSQTGEGRLPDVESEPADFLSVARSFFFQ